MNAIQRNKITRSGINFLKNILMALLCIFCSFPISAQNFSAVGIKKIAVNDPVSQQPMQAVAFFPSHGQADHTVIGPYELAVSRQAAIAEGAFPVILLSHGTMGSMLGHHDFASGLAQQGYMVVSVMHPGDNFQDPRLIGTSSVIYGRALQISAALSAALADPLLSDHIEKDRIAFIGFSAGGATGLILAGAKPEFSRLIDYCATRPEDQHVCAAKGKIGIEDPQLVPSADARIRSLVLLAPLSVIFSPEELKTVKAPLLIFSGNKDEELSPSENAISLAKQTNGQLTLLPEAGHYVFLAPCSAEMAGAMPVLCSDNQGIDRIAIHQDMTAKMADFFAKTLASTHH